MAREKRQAVQSQPGKLLIDTGRTRNRAGDEGSKTEQGIGSAGADTKQVKPEQSRSVTAVADDSEHSPEDDYTFDTPDQAFIEMIRDARKRVSTARRWQKGATDTLRRAVKMKMAAIFDEAHLPATLAGRDKPDEKDVQLAVLMFRVMERSRSG